MDNLSREEFGRQAAAMATAPAFQDEQALQRIITAMALSLDQRVLEIACGPGIVAQAVAPLVGELVCIDATPQMLTLAKQRLGSSGQSNVTFMEAFAEQLPFGSAEFDLIVTRLSFHHFADIQAVLSECRRILRPQGRLVVADIVASADCDKARLHNTLERLRDPSHVRMLAEQELLDTLRYGGFEPRLYEAWQQQRSFTEWAKIASAETRTAPLYEVMRTLCHAGLDAGLFWQETEDDLLFRHSWALVVADRVP